MFSVKSVIKPGLQSLTETNRVITNYIDVLSLLCGISQITTLPYGQHASTTHPTINIVTSDLLANHLRGRYLDEKKIPNRFGNGIPQPYIMDICHRHARARAH